MSSLVNEHIARLDSHIELTQSRINALSEIRDTIANVDVFTAEEQQAVQSALDDAQLHLSERQEARRRAVVTLETTIRQCEKDMTERERILDQLFSKEVMRDYPNMMEFFCGQHSLLKDTLSRSIPMEDE